MLVGIFEKSRRVRTARNSLFVESDMSSPVARPRVRGLLLGSREQKRMLVKQSLPPGTSVRPFGVAVLVPATPKARCAAPREAFCGVQTWYVASTREAATKGADAGQTSSASARR